MVSRATAYRYFPSVEALLVEVPVEGATPDPQTVFADDSSTNPVQRIDRAEAALHEMCHRNEAQLRLMLAASLQRARTAGGDIPVRQNRRMPLIEAALAPARGEFSLASYKRLCAALAMVFGPESMIVFRDVLGIDEKSAWKIKSWTVQTLVRAAIEE
jgi:AcrR family transcriptional regulator